MKYIRIEMPCCKIFEVPRSTVELHHATYNVGSYNGDVSASLDQGTIPLFDNNDSEAMAWITTMTWAELSSSAVLIYDKPTINYDEELKTSYWQLVEK